MVMTRREIADLIYREMGYTKTERHRLIESFFDIIKDELAKGNEVMISGFGKWSVKKKNPRKGRNLQTGEIIPINARTVVTFKPAAAFRQILTDDPQDKGK